MIDGIKAANHLPLRWEIILDYSDGLRVITRVPVSEKGGRRECQSDVTWGKHIWPLLALRMKGSQKPRNAGGL